MRNTLRGHHVELPPLAPFRELTEINDDVFQVYVDYVSPCQIEVSNDPLEPVVEPNPCNITLYDCSGEVADGTRTTSDGSILLVEWDYEMHITSGANFDETREGLEASILEHLATATGLADCPITEFVTRERELQQFPDLFDALSSEPTDERDQDFVECTVSVESSVTSTTNCQTMTGFLTAFIKDEVTVDDDTEAFVRGGLLRFIREGMQNDIYVSGNMRKASFIGTRTNDEPPLLINNGENTSGDSSGDGGLDALWIALLSVGAFFALTLAVLVFLYRRNRRVNENQKELSRHVSFAVEPAVVSDDLDSADDAALYRRPNDMRGIEHMEGADIPGSLATTDCLALKKQQQGRGLNGEASAPAAAPATQSGSSVVAGVAAVPFMAATKSSSRRNNEKRSSSNNHQRKKKRREKERRKKMPSLEGCSSLDSIPEEDSDDELLAEQLASSESGGEDDVGDDDEDQSSEEVPSRDDDHSSEEGEDDDSVQTG